MSFLSPGRLWLLLAVAALVAVYLLAQRRRTAYAVRFTNLDLLDRIAPKRPGWRRHAPAGAFLLMLGLLVVGFAKPTAEVQVPRERATVMVAIDVSNSMQATDVAPNRLEAAQQAAGAFVDQLPERFNVGLVTFSGSAQVVVAPTQDHAAVRQAVRNLSLGPATAIGDAVFSSLQGISTVDEGLAEGDAAADGPAPARIVLMSDGSNTAGRSPAEAAQAARAAGVPVSTIAYGTDSGTITLGGSTQAVPVDEESLAELAEATGGEAYTAASGEELSEVYADIGSSVGTRAEEREVSGWFIGGGLLAAAVAAGLSLLWFSRLP
ncbi:MAG: Aerotolerance protein BatA [uncultured Corynebacteriales bacterium]|uniref:Aerotolerance protein BatA n=1 Tax=uncultured Mycobacteriales bacterium TaxID=581187 RepID=A0A6J4JIJ0_9ACTN|nr:MAG: Aerotolerance protein BatA [uncultured Corynebacteriales bacterium]